MSEDARAAQKGSKPPANKAGEPPSSAAERPPKAAALPAKEETPERGRPAARRRLQEAGGQPPDELASQDGRQKYGTGQGTQGASRTAEGYPRRSRGPTGPGQPRATRGNARSAPQPLPTSRQRTPLPPRPAAEPARRRWRPRRLGPVGRGPPGDEAEGGGEVPAGHEERGRARGRPRRTRPAHGQRREYGTPGQGGDRPSNAPARQASRNGGRVVGHAPAPRSPGATEGSQQLCGRWPRPPRPRDGATASPVTGAGGRAARRTPQGQPMNQGGPRAQAQRRPLGGPAEEGPRPANRPGGERAAGGGAAHQHPSSGPHA